MAVTHPKQHSGEDPQVVADATSGDEKAFAMLTRRYRRELHVHCYRMLASFEDAEDIVQETFLRAWQKRETYQGRASFRAWLYRIATNACIDFLEHNERRVVDISVRGSPAPDAALTPHVPWLQPYPNRLLEPSAPGDAAPDAKLVRKETIELGFMVAMQLLPPKQRAVLILREVLDWSANETADLLDSTVAAVNGALQRARGALRDRQPNRDTYPSQASDAPERERHILQQYIEATERNDPSALARTLREDVRFAMPPEPIAYAGRDAVVGAWVQGGFGAPPFNDWRHVVTSANGMPAIAWYLRKEADGRYHPFTLDVLRVDDGEITEVTAFDLRRVRDAFGLPEELP